MPRPLAHHLSALLQVDRRKRGTRRGRRARTPFRQAVLVLRWFRQDTPLTALARDAGGSIATATGYLREGIDVLAAQAPDLPAVLRGHLTARCLAGADLGEVFGEGDVPNPVQTVLDVPMPLNQQAKTSGGAATWSTDVIR